MLRRVRLFVCVYMCLYMSVGPMCLICLSICLSVYMCACACMYVFYIFEYILYVCRVLTYSSDALAQGILKSVFCLHTFPHAITENRACGTESPAIVGKARYASATLANHVYMCMYVSVCVCMFSRACTTNAHSVHL